MLEGLDVFVGAEALIGQGLAAGAAGAVSGLASAFPEVVVEAVRTRRLDRGRRAARGRRPLPAPRGVEGRRRRPRRADAPDVRGPLRGLTSAERDELLAAVG